MDCMGKYILLVLFLMLSGCNGNETTSSIDVANAPATQSAPSSASSTPLPSPIQSASPTPTTTPSPSPSPSPSVCPYMGDEVFFDTLIPITATYTILMETELDWTQTNNTTQQGTYAFPYGPSNIEFFMCQNGDSGCGGLTCAYDNNGTLTLSGDKYCPPQLTMFDALISEFPEIYGAPISVGASYLLNSQTSNCTGLGSQCDWESI